MQNMESSTSALGDCFNDTVFEDDSPAKSNGLSVSDIIDILGTSNASNNVNTPSTPIVPTTITEIITIPDTPLPAQKSSVSDISAPKIPLSMHKTSLDVVNSPKTPTIQISSTKTIVVPDTPQTKSIDDIINHIVTSVTESEEEMLLRTPPRTSKLDSKSSKSEAAPSQIAANPIKPDDSTPKAIALEIEPLQNGICDENDEYPKWGGSVRRKSDGQPIDKFGVNEVDTGKETLTVKRDIKKISIVSLRDSSADEDEDSNEETKSQNMFLDDEAMESHGEASMDEDERRYLEENEIPVDGISLASESDNSTTDGSESNDSFIVSDSSILLLDGSGDDLDIDNGPSELSKSESRRKRSNRICDTSDEELELEKKPRKSSVSKRQSENSLHNPAKYAKVDDGDDEDELANLDVEPKKTRSSKRLSESKSLSKKDMKRLSLHPNMKFSSLKSNEDKQQSTVDKTHLTILDSSEEDVTQELSNLEDEPKATVGSRRLSESVSSSKKGVKRLSLNEKENQLTVNENGQTTANESKKEDVNEELDNLDDEPKKTKKSNRLSDVKKPSKKEMKRLSLHPNTKLSFLESNVGEQQQQSTVNESDPIAVDDESDEDVKEVLANVDDEPKISKKAKRLSDSNSISKKDLKRLSTKLNSSAALESHVESIVNNEPSNVPKIDSEPLNDVDTMEVDHSDNVTDSAPPSTSQQQKLAIEHSVEEIQAKCDAFLQIANEAKREEKLKNKGMQVRKISPLLTSQFSSFF